MKKVFKVLSLFLVTILLVGCANKTASSVVEDFLNQYNNLSSNVLEDMNSVVESEDLTEEQKDKYRDILKRQYQDLTYKIVSESYDGDDAIVVVEITVYDLYKVQNDANTYLNENSEEFMENNTFSNELFMDYKLEQMQNVTDTVTYTITFNVSKDEDGNYQITNLSETDLQKIHGIYNYDAE